MCPYSEFFWSVLVYFVSHRIQFECGEIRTRKTTNTDTFDSVRISYIVYGNRRCNYRNTLHQMYLENNRVKKKFFKIKILKFPIERGKKDQTV